MTGGLRRNTGEPSPDELAADLITLGADPMEVARRTRLETLAARAVFGDDVLARGRSGALKKLRQSAFAGRGPLVRELTKYRDSQLSGPDIWTYITTLAALAPGPHSATQESRYPGRAAFDRLCGALSGRIRDDGSLSCDLVGGAAGAGLLAIAYLTGPLAEKISGQVVERLYRTAHFAGEACCWPKLAANLGPTRAALYPNGACDLGMAHGQAGIVAFLLAACASPTPPGRTHQLLRAASNWLLKGCSAEHEQPTPGLFGVPLFGLHENRQGWCYGAPSIALTLLRAGRSLGDAAMEDAALRLAESSIETAMVRCFEPWICHGACGLALICFLLADLTAESRWRGIGEIAARSALMHPWQHETQTVDRFLAGPSGTAAAIISLRAHSETDWAPSRWEQLLGLSNVVPRLPATIVPHIVNLHSENLAEARRHQRPRAALLLRTPRFAFGTLLGGDQQDYGSAAERLRALVETPTVRLATWLSSSSLFRSLGDCPRIARLNDAELAAYRLVCRMSYRGTPYGVCAAITRVQLHEEASFSLCEIPKRTTRYSRCRLMANLVAAGERLFSTPSLYLVREEYKWYTREAADEGIGEASHLQSAERTAGLTALLDAAACGATDADILSAMREAGVDLTSAAAALERALASQLLLREQDITLEPSRDHVVVPTIMERLAACDEASERDALDVYLSLESRPAEQDRQHSRAVVVDSIRSGSAQLPRRVLDRAVSGGERLMWLTPPSPDPLSRFRSAFEDRYGEQFVPLLEALDPSAGAGASLRPAAVTHAATDSQESAEARASRAYLNRREEFLAALLAGGSDARGVQITDEMLNQFARPPLSRGAYSIAFSLIAKNAEAVSMGAYRILLRGIASVGAETTVSRFAHLDPAIASDLRDIAELEQAQDPSSIFADVLFRPLGKAAEIVSRTPLRAVAIDCGARLDGYDKVLPLGDLLVAVHGPQLVLWSQSLEKRVFPRVAHALNPAIIAYTPFRFLELLQRQGSHAGNWDWGPFRKLHSLPRVTWKNCVLSPARWRLDARNIAHIQGAGARDRRSSLERVRESLGMTRYLRYVDGDQGFPVDLENELSVDAMLDEVRSDSTAVFEELLPAPTDLVARIGATFCYSELSGAVWWDGPDPATDAGVRSRWEHRAARREYSTVGEEWNYVKVYCEAGDMDELIVRIADCIDNHPGGEDWFLVRYHDRAGRHIRLRIAQDPRAAGHIGPLSDLLISTCGVHRSQIVPSCYTPEIWRYGGRGGLSHAHGLFCADTRYVVDVLRAVHSSSTNNGEDVLLLAGVLSCSEVLIAWRMDLDARIAFCERTLERLRLRGFGLTGRGGANAREMRDSAVRLIGALPARPLEQYLLVLADARTDTTRVDIEALRWHAFKRSSGDGNAVLGSLLHMNLNRLGFADAVSESDVYKLLLRATRTARAQRGAVLG